MSPVLKSLPRRLVRDRRGSAAIEFALLIAPLLLLLLGILEVSVQYFVATAVDYAVQRTARLIRTGQAQEQHYSSDVLKQVLCADISDLMNCQDNVYVTVDELQTLTANITTLPIGNDGGFIEDQAPNMGAGGSYIIVRDYFQYAPLFGIFGAISPRLDNGNHLVVASALFRNEPF